MRYIDNDRVYKMLDSSFYIVIIENETITKLMNDLPQTEQIRVCS